MYKSNITQGSGYYSIYVERAPDTDVITAINSSGIPIIEAARDMWSDLGDAVYAPDKWTIKEILQHAIDTERIFSYRALCISRGDGTPLPGFDQDIYIENCNVHDRDIDDIIKELISVRQASLYLYKSISPEAMIRTGTASGLEMSPLLLGFLISGHLMHHQKIIEERYYPLKNEI